MFGKIASETMVRLYLNDPEIYEYYFDFDINRKFNSPFRDDPKPSLSFKATETGNIIFKDFGMVNQKYYDSIGFVSMLLDCSRYEACHRIWNDLVIERGESPFQDKVVFKPTPNEYTFEYSELDDISYWEKYHISRETLLKANVFKLDNLYYKGTKVLSWGPSFIYLFGGDSWKTYAPYEDRLKFRSNDIGKVVECIGLTDRPDAPLIITSSTKDAMVLYECGYNSIAPTSENARSGLMEHLGKLREKFDYIYVMYDNDDPGRKASEALMKTFKYIEKDIYTKELKDPSDYSEKYGLFKLKELIKNQIHG